MKKRLVLPLFLVLFLLSSSIVYAGWFSDLFRSNEALVGKAYASSARIKEKITCIFQESSLKQACSSSKGSCRGIGRCTINVVGKEGEQVTWQSSCGGYAITTIDGKEENANFNCGAGKACTDTTGTHKVGESWTAADGCNTCYCNPNGMSVCTKKACRPTTCTNECSYTGQKECVPIGPGNPYRVCGNYDTDSCLEWSKVQNCQQGYKCSGGNCVQQINTTSICTDSDGGAKEFIKGITKGFEIGTKNLISKEDYCMKASEFPGGNQNEVGVLEFFCDGPNSAYDYQYVNNGFKVCTNGCSNGACITSSASSITVLSPNGGESWIKGTTQTIKWQDNTPMPTCPSSTSSGVSSTCVVNARLYDINLATYSLPCPTGAYCAQSPSAIYKIAENIPINYHSWTVGAIQGLYDGFAPEGSYTIQVCQSGTNICDASDAPFSIVAAKKCSAENEFCGGIAGVQCCDGFTCKLDGTYPDAGGKCIKESKKCGDYRYSTCPAGCVKKCVPSVCSGNTCTADCEGKGSCLESGEVKEQVKCVFYGTTQNQKCYSEKGSCTAYHLSCTTQPGGVSTCPVSNQITCVVNVSGKQGEQVTWKSSCGGYAYTTIDGQSEYAEFKCSTPINQSVKCYSNADCPTSISRQYCSGNAACTETTSYQCLNPGTVNSACSKIGGGGACRQCQNGCNTATGTCNQINQSVKCYSDKDCPPSSTKKYCSGNSSACEETIKYQCLNPGTANSFCSASSGGGCGYCVNGCNAADGTCISSTTYTLADYPKMFFKDGNFNGIFVVGDYAPAAHVIGISDISSSLQFYCPQGSTTCTRIPVGVAKLASEVASLNQNIISVGSACENSITATIEGKPQQCNADLEQGVGKIKMYPNNGYTHLVVKGYVVKPSDDYDTRNAATVLANYKDYSGQLVGKEVEVRKVNNQLYVSQPMKGHKCYRNADCPTSISRQYCSGNAACTETVSYQCINPGTVNSACSKIGGGGACRQCQNGCNTATGTCNKINQTVKCYSDKDCPQSTTKKYCSGNSACEETVKYQCLNPGTANSLCSASSGGGCGYCTDGCNTLDGTCTKKEGYYKAQWECYDSYSVQASSKAALPSETWQKYAARDCEGHCNEDGSKCGVNSFSVS